MDPITAGIVAALPNLASQSVKDSYDALKALIRRKWGENDPVLKAIKALEEDPSSIAQASVLSEKVSKQNAGNEFDIAQSLAKLVDALNAKGLGAEQTAHIQFQMNGGTIVGVGYIDTLHVDTWNING